MWHQGQDVKSHFLKNSPQAFQHHGGGGGGVNFHYKGIYRCAAGMGYTFQASQYMNGYHFYIKSISIGYLFQPKSIWMGKIWKIVYEWGQFSKIVYEWGQFSIWEVYEWVMFFTWPSIWMGWGSGTPAAHPYPKSWQVTPRVQHKDVMLFFICREENAVTDVNVTWLSLF